MRAGKARETVGCLYIDALTKDTASGSDTSGRFLLEDLAGMAVRPFRCGASEHLWAALQEALQALRRDFPIVVIAARDTGCAAALALAVQLPVDRLALIDPTFAPPTGGAGEDRARLRAVRRLGRFALGNLPLCAADVLLACHAGHRPPRALERGDLSRHSRVLRLELPGRNGDELFTNRENPEKQAISHFLQAGEWPKPLAQNPEMCIMYR